MYETQITYILIISMLLNNLWLKPVSKHEKKVREGLAKTYAHLGGAFAGVVGVAAGEEESALKDSGFDDSTFYPYVNIEFWKLFSVVRV